jgi:hypothetical protein
MIILHAKAGAFKRRILRLQFGIWAHFWQDAGASNNFAAQNCDQPAKRQKPGFPLQVLGSAYALPVGFPLQSLARPGAVLAPVFSVAAAAGGDNPCVFLLHKKTLF